MRAGKIAAIVGGAVLVLIGLALILPGGFLLWAHGTQRDSDGYYGTSSRVLSTNAYAITTPDVNLHVEPWVWIRDGENASVRLDVESTGTTPLFIGIGPTDLVNEYLAGVGRDEVTSFGGWFQTVDYRRLDGEAPSTAPGKQGFWAATAEGSGDLELVWAVRNGSWTAVMMNADGSPQVSSAVSVGARLGIIFPLGIGLVLTGVVLLGLGFVLIFLGARRPRTAQPTYPTGQVPPAGQVPPTGPVPPPGQVQTMGQQLQA